MAIIGDRFFSLIKNFTVIFMTVIISLDLKLNSEETTAATAALWSAR
jgi:hypothetical protein